MGQKPLNTNDFEPVEDELDTSDFEPLDTSDFEPLEVAQPTVPKSRFGEMWDRVSQPLFDLPSRIGTSIADTIDNPQGEGGFGRGFLAGTIKGVGDLTTEMTSPLSLASTALSGGSNMLGKFGLQGASKILQGVSAVPGVAEGIGTAATGNPLMGIAQAGMSLLGAKKMGGPTAPKVTPPAPNLASTVKIKKPTQELLNKLRSQGYSPSHVGEDGFPVWKLTDRGASAKPKKAAPGFAKQAYDLSRGVTTTLDLSAPLRQGLGLIHKKEFWTSLDDMIKAVGSKKAYDDIMNDIKAKPLFTGKTEDIFDDKGMFVKTKNTPSFAEDAGLALTDMIDNREEAIIGKWAEKIPGAKASNRGYTAYLNKLRADTFESMIKDAKLTGLNPEQDLEVAKKIAGFINAASGRGSLGGLEKNAEMLTNVIFSPRLMASRLKMLNPGTYISQKNAGVRQEYLKSMLAMGTMWATVGGMAKMAGAEVSFDPTNADFGKIKIGDTRIDPAGGFQQYLVAMARFAKGETTSSTSGNTREFGAGFGSPTRLDMMKDFGSNKLHPVLKFAYDLANASEYKNVHMMDRILQMYTPLIVQDITEIAKSNPELIPLSALAALGMGTQTYDKGNKEGLFVPAQNDFVFEGGKLF